MIILYYLILFFLLSISGKDKKKDAKVYFNVLFPKNDKNKEKSKKMSMKTPKNPVIREIKTEEFIEEIKSTTEYKVAPIEKQLSKENPKINDNLNKEGSFIEDIDWKIQDEVEKLENYQKIDENIICASKQKSFAINLNDVMIITSSIPSSFKNSEDKDLSKKENTDTFLDFKKYDDKLKCEFQQNEEKNQNDLKKMQAQHSLSIKSNHSIKNLTEKKLKNCNLKIRVSFMAEKKSIIKINPIHNKRESKLRKIRNFSFKNIQVKVIDDKYFLDSFFPFFSILRYSSKTNPKLKRILLLALTFQVYMLFAAILYNNEV